MRSLLPGGTPPDAGRAPENSQAPVASSGNSAAGPAFRSWLTGLILGGTWIFCVLAAWWLTAQTSPLVPKYDDWLVIVPVATGHNAISPAWFRENLNEHKIPLPRLAYLAALLSSGGDFRAGSFLTVLLLSLVSLGAMLAVRRWRGTSSLADAFFPLLLLHWGQTHLFVVGSCLNFSIPLTLYYLAAFLVVARPEGSLGARNYPAVILLLGAMALCGLVGVVLALSLLVWLGIIGLSWLRDAGRRRQACYCLTLVLGVGALMVWNFSDFTRPSPQARAATAFDPGPQIERLRTLLAMSFGWLGDWNPTLVSAGIVILGILTVWALGMTAGKSPGERERFAGLIALVFSVPLVLVSISVGRSFLTVGELWGMTHYAALGVAFVAILYVMSLFCFPPRIASLVRGSLFLVALLVFAGNLFFPDRHPRAFQVVQRLRAQENLLVHNLASGQPFPQAAQAFFGNQTDDRPERGAAYLEMLSNAHMGPFAPDRKMKECVEWWDSRRPEDRLVLTDPLAWRYLGYGWSLALSSQGRWTCGTEATLRFQAKAPPDHLLTIRFYPFLVAGKLDRQRLKLLLNGTPIWETVLDQARLYEQTIPLPAPSLRDRNVLLLQMPDATAPKALGVNLDPDKHAILLESVRIH